MRTEFKQGDIVMFLKDIKAGYERDHVMLIHAGHPCKILKSNGHAMTVSTGTSIEVLRYIPSRMKHCTELASAIYT